MVYVHTESGLEKLLIWKTLSTNALNPITWKNIEVDRSVYQIAVHKSFLKFERSFGTTKENQIENHYICFETIASQLKKTSNIYRYTSNSYVHTYTYIFLIMKQKLEFINFLEKV